MLQIIKTKTDTRRWALALDSTYGIKCANGGAAVWRERDWVGVACTLVAHVDLWMQVLDLLSRVDGKVTVFHVHSHINLQGNDKADELANKGRLMSDLYSHTLAPERPPKRAIHYPPDLAEVEVVLSSDEELDRRYNEARCSSQNHHTTTPPRHRGPLQ